MVQKKLAIPNVNIYSGQLGKSWSKVKKVFHYNNKPYILKTFGANLLERNYHDLLTRYFRVKKTLELCTRKYYQPKRRINVEIYIQVNDICMSSKAQKHKPYSSLQLLPTPTYKQKDLSIDIVTRLPNCKNWRRVEYDLIVAIVNQPTKIVYYKPVFTTLTAKRLTEILIEIVIKYYGPLDYIVIDQRLLFTLKFWSFFYYYLNVQR